MKKQQALESNPKLVEWEAVQKWNGQGCTQNCFGAGTAMPVPFLNVSK